MSEYRKPSATHRCELIIKNSRFITTVAATPDRSSAEAFVAQLKAEHPSANHNCWAHIAGSPDDSRNRGCSDDGEPKGTAGRPMLTVLDHSGLGEVTVVVTRYFGGVKLGTGGLVRAYSQAVREALETLPTTLVVPKEQIEISAPFEMTGQLEQLLSQFSVEVQERQWEAQLKIYGEIETAQLEGLTTALQPYPSIVLKSFS